jgi:putative Ca2+/H+ antiporter (TMEM165/GDT1 family)
MNGQLFISIFLLIFIAELPDKTAFATLILAARGRALAVFVGVAAAFFVQTLVAVAFGSVIALLPAKWVHLGAGVLFIVFAGQMWRERGGDDADAANADACEISFWAGAHKAFVVIFIALWGDITQLATASLIAKYSESKLTVFAAAVAALWSVTGVAVLIGQKAKEHIKPRLIKTVGASLFLAIGLYFLVATLSRDF